MTLTGRWRIVEMDLWDLDAIDLVGPGFIEFGGDDTGGFGFIAVQGWMDCRHGERDGRPCVEFTWEGNEKEIGSAAVGGRRRMKTVRSGDTSTSTSAMTRASGRCRPRSRREPARGPPGEVDERQGSPGG